MAKIKCPQCLKIVSETDNCDGCDKTFGVECLTYRGEKDSEGELAFREKTNFDFLLSFLTSL